MKLHEVYQKIKPVLLEGGKVFPGQTAPFDHDLVKGMIDELNQILGPIEGVRALPIGSGANPVPGKKMGDLDIIIDAQAVMKHFGVADIKTAKQQLEQLFAKKYDTAKSGQSVHVKLNPPGSSSGAQVDIMVVPNAEKVAKFHTHQIPPESQYKGKHKQIAMSKLARNHGYKWSAFRGLMKPDTEQAITDLEQIAKILLGPTASAQNLTSLEAMLQALPNTQAADLMNDLSKDKQFIK